MVDAFLAEEFEAERVRGYLAEVTADDFLGIVAAGDRGTAALWRVRRVCNLELRVQGKGVREVGALRLLPSAHHQESGSRGRGLRAVARRAVVGS